VRPWTHAEEEALRVLAPLGSRHLAKSFDRSVVSIQHKASQLRIRLGRKSNGSQLVVTDCTPATLRKVAELSQADLCPSCAKRPIGVKSTGLCGPCHLEALKAVHEEEIAKADAQRALWAARSKLRRRRSLAMGSEV
jgi:hypothetical protein